MLPVPTPRATSLPAAPDIGEAAAQALAHAHAPETRRIYALHRRAFEAWLGGTPLLRATPVDVANFLAEAGANRSHSWRAQAAAAIGHAFRKAGHPAPTAHPGVRRTLRGLRRQQPGAPQQAAPLTETALAAIEATALLPRTGRGGHPERPDAARRRGLTDIALARTLRDALLRRSEAARLTWQDLTTEPDGSGRLNISGPTKTDPEGARPHTAYLTRATVQALEAIAPPDGDAHTTLFGLSARQIARRIQAAATAAGLPGRFSGHSGRTGAAHSLAAHGATLVELQQAGRWQSPNMPAAYARQARAAHSAVARLLEP